MKRDDGRVDMEIDLEDDLLFDLMLRAHHQDITLNQLIEQILTQVIEEHKNDKIRTEGA